MRAKPHSSLGNGAQRLGEISSRPTLVYAAAQVLRESILDGRFAPGERLFEAHIATKLGISRGPLREALQLLEQEGIVSNIPRRGKFVQQLDERDVDDLYTLRKVLEVFAVERVVGIGSDEELGRLELAVEAIRTSAEAGDARATARLDIAFHGTLYEMAHHSMLYKAWSESIAGKLQILLNSTTRTHHDLHEPIQKHEIIVKAIQARDMERARMEVAIHVEDARRRALRMLKREHRTARVR